MAFRNFIFFRAIESRPDLHCFWKSVGDACFALGVIAEEKLRFVFPSTDELGIISSIVVSAM